MNPDPAALYSTAATLSPVLLLTSVVVVRRHARDSSSWGTVAAVVGTTMPAFITVIFCLCALAAGAPNGVLWFVVGLVSFQLAVLLVALLMAIAFPDQYDLS